MERGYFIIFIIWGCYTVLFLVVELLLNSDFMRISGKYASLYSVNNLIKKTNGIHLLVNLNQFLRSGGLFMVFYLIASFRLRYECEAYCARVNKVEDQILKTKFYQIILDELQVRYKTKISHPQIIERCLHSYLMAA